MLFRSRALHARIVEALETLAGDRVDDQVERLAQHALRGEVWPKALAYGRQAGDKAQARSAYRETVVCYEQALAALAGERLDDQVERLAYHALRGEVWEKALAYCRQAGEKAMTRSAHREAMGYYEQALSALSHLPECRDTLEQAIDLRCDLRNALLTLGEQTRIFDYLREAEALAERLGDDQRLGRVAGYLCIYFSNMGEHDRAITAGQRALALATTSGAFDDQIVAQTALGIVYNDVGDFRQALDFFQRVRALLTGEQRYAHFGSVAPPAVTSRGRPATCLAELGDFAEGRGLGEEAVRLAEAIAQPYTLAIALMFVGVVYRRQGDISQAVSVLERVLALSQSANIPRVFPLTASILSATYALAGRIADALPLLGQTLERIATGSRMLFHALVLTELSEALLLVDRVDEASRLTSQLLDLSRTHAGRGYQAHAYRLLGDVTMRREPLDVDQAAGHYRQALALAEELGMRPLQAHCHRGLGTLYAATGQQEQTRTALSTAIALYRAMEMTFWLPQAEGR